MPPFARERVNTSVPRDMAYRPSVFKPLHISDFAVKCLERFLPDSPIFMTK